MNCQKYNTCAHTVVYATPVAKPVPVQAQKHKHLTPCKKTAFFLPTRPFPFYISACIRTSALDEWKEPRLYFTSSYCPYKSNNLSPLGFPSLIQSTCENLNKSYLNLINKYIIKSKHDHQLIFIFWSKFWFWNIDI